MNSCGEIPESSPSKLLLGAFLSVGMLVSYLPQGISVYFLLLGSLSSFATVSNILLLQSKNFACCFQSQWTGLICLENIMGFIQVAIQLLCLVFFFSLYIAYFPEHLKFEYSGPIYRPNPNHNRLSSFPSHSHIIEYRASPQWRRSIQVGLFLIACFFIFFLTSFRALWLEPPESLTWPSSLPIDIYSRSPSILALATFFGVFATILAIVQFVPQIVTTFLSRRVGALSIPTMLIQCPGSFLFVYSIYIQPGTNWTSYVSYLFSATLQGILLFICIVWHFRDSQDVAYHSIDDDEEVV